MYVVRNINIYYWYQGLDAPADDAGLNISSNADEKGDPEADDEDGASSLPSQYPNNQGDAQIHLNKLVSGEGVSGSIDPFPPPPTLPDTTFEHIEKGPLLILADYAIEDTPPKTQRSISSWSSPYAACFDLTVQDTKLVHPKESLQNPLSVDHLSNDDLANIQEAFQRWVEDGIRTSRSRNLASEDHYKPNCFQIYAPMDFVVAFPDNKNWFYCMGQPNVCWNDEHLDVIFYYLRKLAKVSTDRPFRFTTASCFFKDKINEKYDKYIQDTMDTSLFREDDAICNYIRGQSLPAAVPWHLVDDVYIPINCKEKLHWVLAVVSLRRRSISIYDSMRDAGKQHRATMMAEFLKISRILPHYLRVSGFLEKNDRVVWKLLDPYIGKNEDEPFTVIYEENVPQQKAGRLDCGVFVAAFVELLSKGIQLQSAVIDADKYRARYASLVWNYGVKKYADGYKSHNDDPPKPRRHVFDADEAPDTLSVSSD